jgi:hypothetical protein
VEGDGADVEGSAGGAEGDVGGACAGDACAEGIKRGIWGEMKK